MVVSKNKPHPVLYLIIKYTIFAVLVLSPYIYIFRDEVPFWGEYISDVTTGDKEEDKEEDEEEDEEEDTLLPKTVKRKLERKGENDTPDYDCSSVMLAVVCVLVRTFFLAARWLYKGYRFVGFFSQFAASIINKSFYIFVSHLGGGQ